jgi:serine/threonine protein phosphatase PrpC
MVSAIFPRRGASRIKVLASEASIHLAQSLGARDRQEDAGLQRIYDNGDAVLTLVADGMGGHEGGEVASKAVVETFTREYFHESAMMRTPQRLAAALARANQGVAARIRESPELDGMGSTVVAVVASRDGLSWASVGDSLLLHIRGEKVERLNEDHSMAPLLDAAARKGDLTPDQSASHRDRNALRSAVLGSQLDIVDINEMPVRLRRGDVVLAASDGLTTLSYAEIAKIVARHRDEGAKAIVEALLAAVAKKNKRRQDNTTVAAMIFTADSSAPQIGGGYRRAHLALAAAIGALLIAGMTVLVPMAMKPSQLLKTTIEKAEHLGAVASGLVEKKPAPEVTPLQLDEGAAPQATAPTNDPPKLGVPLPGAAGPTPPTPSTVAAEKRETIPEREQESDSQRVTAPQRRVPETMTERSRPEAGIVTPSPDPTPAAIIPEENADPTAESEPSPAPNSSDGN